MSSSSNSAASTTAAAADDDDDGDEDEDEDKDNDEGDDPLSKTSNITAAVASITQAFAVNASTAGVAVTLKAIAVPVTGRVTIEVLHIEVDQLATVISMGIVVDTAINRGIRLGNIPAVRGFGG